MIKLQGGKKWDLQEQAQRQNAEVCSCGRGLATHSIWDGGMSFGEPSMVKVCEKCYLTDQGKS